MTQTPTQHPLHPHSTPKRQPARLYILFKPGLGPEIGRVIYSTNAIESLHARMRRATRAKGHSPNRQTALKCLYMVVRSLDSTRRGRRRWMNRWNPALNAFATSFEGRLPPDGEWHDANPDRPLFGQTQEWDAGRPSARGGDALAVGLKDEAKDMLDV